MATARDIARSIISTIRAHSDEDGQVTVDIIDAFVAGKHTAAHSTDPKLHNDNVDRLNQDLLILYQQEFPSESQLTIPLIHISPGSPQRRHLLFLRFLHHLLPYLTTQRVFNDWWSLAIEPPLRTQLYITEAS